ncbi:hypothetical protein DH2020_024846 [Rehmannia glutinosa]|uniref:Uncharacterized protein n=1 Tax=Rehmannia glutinosa TaxID=99300 RepID=A0ABR0W181_REHGL
MGKLALETDSVRSNDYAALGLTDSRKGNLGKPQILSLLATLLDKSVQKNERMLETSQTKDVITIFHGLRAPPLTIQQYIDRIFKYSCCSPSCFVIAHIYMDRFIQQTNFFLTSLNIHRLLITSVMVAAKFIDDAEATGGLIERSVQACGVEESWTNKDDSTCAQSIAR